MARGDRGRGRGDRGAGGRGTRGRRGRPRKTTGVPLDLGEAEAETSTLDTTSTPVVLTPSLAEDLPAMRMIPTPGSRFKDDEPPPPEPDLMPWPPVDNPLPEGEEEEVALEEELARQAGRVYLRWDGGNCWNKVRKGTTKITWVFENYYRWFVPQFSMAPDHAVWFWWDRWRIFFRLQRGYEHRIYESWRMRAAKRLREIMHDIRNKGAPHPWIRQDLWDRLVEFWRQEDFKKLKQALELGRTPTQSEVFARTHTRKEDREWVDKRSSDVNDAYEAELKRLQDER
ncbi:hypothetical protein PIB30_081500 [Stylosanthes scabra]|uniref:Uncharacterized protein n=1 Tax=Stylosanthes scabra TaxID=79078 RepID=A0ABU6QRV8_9FABA|nr:hypothetical protein [Stylosanthes scabra]